MLKQLICLITIGLSCSFNQSLEAIEAPLEKLAGYAVIEPSLPPLIYTNEQIIFENVFILNGDVLSFNSEDGFFTMLKQGNYRIYYGGAGLVGRIGLFLKDFHLPLSEIALNSQVQTTYFVLHGNLSPPANRFTIKTIGSTTSIRFAFVQIYFSEF